MKKYEKPQLELIRFQSSRDIANAVTVSNTLVQSKLNSITISNIKEY
ncbi:MAG: hypothetical protein LIO44_03960 [Eubacterium sp.]|nr:hypothetical protein [Eubacterium sp.]